VATSAASGSRTAAKTERLLAAATALAEELGDPESLGRAALAAVMAATGQGQWHRAVKIARQAAALFRERCSGVAWERRTNEDLLLQALNGVGDFHEIGELVPPLLEEARDRDDRYGENLLGIWWARALLVEDRPEEALRHLRNIQERWPGRHFPFPLLNARLVECEIGLYRRDPGTLELLEECSRAASSTQVLAIQMVRIRLEALQARAALVGSARAAGAERHALLAAVERNLRRIEAERAPWGDGLVKVLRGSLLAAQGHPERALHEFRAAEQIALASFTFTLAEVCRHRQGRLLGGTEGRELERDAREQIALRGAAAPERLCDLFAPLAE
jgi:tetratricopeptide (TPR) repeat protein